MNVAGTNKNMILINFFSDTHGFRKKSTKNTMQA